MHVETSLAAAFSSASPRRSVESAAEYIGLSASTMNKLRVRGDGPEFLKLGRRVVYETRALDQWLAGKRRKSTSETGERANA